MKKLIYILLFAVAVTGFTSCSDLLEEENYGNPTTEEMMANPENVVLLVGQAYADLKWVHDHWGYWGVASLTSDECLCPVRKPRDDWADGGYWRNLNTHNWNIFADAFKNIWNSTISGAVLCNRLLGTLEIYKDSMGEKSYKQFVGELEVLRSYYYYLLFDCFGRIPYLEDFETKTEPLMEPQIVWSRLVACLERNAPNMPAVTDGTRAANYGRVTQGFAYALLARLYLNAESFGVTVDNIKNETELTGADREEMPVTYSSLDATFYDANPLVTKIESANDLYTNAIRCCDNIISKGSYQIESDFFTNFKIKNEESKENIFVIVENGDAEFDSRSNGSMSNKLRMITLTLTYPMQTTWDLVELPWNGFCARPTFIDRYYTPTEKFADNKNVDVRGPGNEGNGTNNVQQWGWFLGPVYAKDGKTVMTYKDSGDEKTDAIIVNEIKNNDLSAARNCDGARMLKYEVDKAKTCAWAENDFVLMRYADVLWMKAEAQLRSGQAVTVNLDALKTRAFKHAEDPIAAYDAAYPNVTTDLNALLDERGRELAWEMVRRRDLIRFGKFNDPKYVQYVTAVQQHRNWFPIPFSVLEKSLRDENGDRIWTQNPGY